MIKVGDVRDLWERYVNCIPVGYGTTTAINMFIIVLDSLRTRIPNERQDKELLLMEEINPETPLNQFESERFTRAFDEVNGEIEYWAKRLARGN